MNINSGSFVNYSLLHPPDDWERQKRYKSKDINIWFNLFIITMPYFRAIGIKMKSKFLNAVPPSTRKSFELLFQWLLLLV